MANYHGERFLVVIPLYALLIVSFALFLYFLPGLCDPEVSAQRQPLAFIILTYFTSALVTVVLTHFELHRSDKLVTKYNIYPTVFALSAHLLQKITHSEYIGHTLTLVMLLALMISWTAAYTTIIINARLALALLLWLQQSYELVKWA